MPPRAPRGALGSELGSIIGAAGASGPQCGPVAPDRQTSGGVAGGGPPAAIVGRGLVAGLVDGLVAGVVDRVVDATAILVTEPIGRVARFVDTSHGTTGRGLSVIVDRSGPLLAGPVGPALPTGVVTAPGVHRGGVADVTAGSRPATPPAGNPVRCRRRWVRAGGVGSAPVLPGPMGPCRSRPLPRM